VNLFQWILLDLFLILAILLITYRLVNQTSNRRERYKNILRVIAAYSFAILCWFIYVFYNVGYTLYGAVLYGGLLGGFHIVLVAALLIGLVMIKGT
jgi:ABC-type Co2+ transport system permease subunit